MKCIITRATIFTLLRITTVSIANANSSSNSSKYGSSNEVSMISGRYNGIDNEDGTPQSLSIICVDKFCDIDLSDVLFTTCSLETGNPYFGGVAVARHVPEDSLSDFDLKLFCLEPGQLEIDIGNQNHTTTLTGDLVPLQDGVVRRTGPGFTFFDTYAGDSWGNTSSTSKGGIMNGHYTGIDTEDGSVQGLDILCTDGLCDVILSDIGFSTCAAITGNAFYGGVAIAKGIPEDSLDDFVLGLYCLQKDELEFDIETDNPVSILTGNMIGIQDGIVRRTSTGFTYFKVSSSFAKAPSSSKMSIPIGRYVGKDVEDGSTQNIYVLCNDGKCDVTLLDSSFSTCIKLTGNAYLGGIGIARNINEDSMDRFKIDLYCLQPGKFVIDVDNDDPTTTLTGDMIILEDGIIRRTGPGFNFFNTYTGGASTEKHNSGSGVRSKASSKELIASGGYLGARTEDGASQFFYIICNDGLCDIDLATTSFSTCTMLTGNPFFNGVGIARDIPQDSLDNFDIDLYCLQAGEQVGIDIYIPTTTLKGDVIAIQQDGIIRTAEPEITYFKTSTE